MCGIVGLFLKDPALEPQLGQLLTDMLVTMTNRGPDSAGIAIFGNDADDIGKLTVQSDNPATDFAGVDAELSKALGVKVTMISKDTHAEASLRPLGADRFAP
jgi:methylamine---glutamate N-methyltransferase subunit A